MRSGLLRSQETARLRHAEAVYVTLRMERSGLGVTD